MGDMLSGRIGDANDPQVEDQPMDGRVPNNAGGFSWAVDDMRRLRRFLCLGSEGGSYYVKESELGKENAQAIFRLIAAGKGELVVQEIVKFSVEGRAAKQDPIIFALALCARSDDLTAKKAAYEALNKVCRIPTHLFSFVEFCQNLSAGTGWGRAHRRAVCEWYNTKKHKDLAMAVTKYQSRNGWSHLDLFRLSHLKPANAGVLCVCKYVVKGLDACKEACFEAGEEEVFKTVAFLEVVEAAKAAEEATAMVKFIREDGLVREHVPTDLLNSLEVWEALLEKMPMTAMIRNLGKMSVVGLLKPLSSHVQTVCARLQDEGLLRKARIHPFTLLQALCTYRRGRGIRGKLSWDVNQNVVGALDCAFYKAFKFVEPTGKRFLLAVDVSGSMVCPILGSEAVTARTASAAMAMVTARTEEQYHIVGFSDKLVPLKINAGMSLESVCDVINKVPMGGTDCALPMLYAKKKGLEVDVFIVYTDSETWIPNVHPTEALRQYRAASGIDARLIVCAMTATEFTIADPEDAGMLDMAGFDSAAPEIIRTFAMGEI